MTSRPHGFVTSRSHQLAFGALDDLPGPRPIVRHTCDKASCQNPAHWQPGARVANVADYLTRRHRDHGPLADLRGPAGRAVAIRQAIRTAKAEGRDVELAIAAAIAAGTAQAPGLF